MHKGFTLLEVLTVMLILSLLALQAVPLWHELNEKSILINEQHKLKLFLRQIQQKSSLSNQIWLVMVSRQLEQQHWCLTAQLKQPYLCDCLQPENCPKELEAHFYYPYFPQQSMIISNKYYPEEMSRFNGIRDTLVSTCLLLQVGKEQTLFSLFNVGTIRLKEKENMSACVAQDE